MRPRTVKTARVSVGALLALGIYFVAPFLRQTDGSIRWVALVGGLLLVACQFALTLLASRSDENRGQEFKRTVYDVLQPLGRQLERVASARARNARTAEAASFMTAAVNASAGLAPKKRTRATIFRRDATNAFVPTYSAGRGDESHSVFRRGDPAGDEVWDAAERDLERFCRDTHQEPPQGFDPALPRKYRTFITVPVWSGNELVGLLTINAPKPGDLTEDDVGTMRVMAGLIGAALSVNGGAWPVSGG